ncbi:BRO-N domain-containing protein [Lachnoanaerobaculum sp.]|uniref:BRO-N domain-containing protein n=1 Tax=Lachnoanaerobaculum sp. TaxID=2049030 RepID=UPI0025C15875|nr:BRO family protein [Lachnoanaerobaculum sp.]
MFLQTEILGGDFIKIEKWCNHDIRFVEINGEWWAVLKDVCNALGLDTRMTSRRLEKDVLFRHPLETAGGQQEMLIVGEYGIYEVIFRSNKPEAKDFRKWVYRMLSELRKASGYEGFEIFRMLDKEHQKEMMKKLQEGLKKPARVDYIKANTIANKAVSLKHGYPKMVKKATMTPEMLKDREPILADTVELMAVKDKYGLDVSVSDMIYKKNEEKVG